MFELLGVEITQCRMAALPIIPDRDPFEDGSAGLLPCGKRATVGPPTLLMDGTNLDQKALFLPVAFARGPVHPGRVAADDQKERQHLSPGDDPGTCGAGVCGTTSAASTGGSARRRPTKR